MSNDNIKPIYTFTVLSDRLVDETTERTETIDGVERVVTETIKVNKPVPTHFAFKKPSRPEREQAKEEEAVAWSRYVEKGILPESILLKTYANAGGILSNEQRAEYTADRVAYATKQEELLIIKAIKETPADEVTRLMTEMINLRDKIIRFEQEQSTFFENTAEAKARVKLSEHLVLSLSYTRASETDAWTRYFRGQAALDSLEEAGDKVFAEAYPQLLFLATFLANSDYAATKEDIDEFLRRRA